MIKILTLKILLFSLCYTNLCNFYFTLDFIEPIYCGCNMSFLIFFGKNYILLYIIFGENY